MQAGLIEAFLGLVLGKACLVLGKTCLIGLDGLGKTGFLGLDLGLGFLDFWQGIGVLSLKEELVNLPFQGLFGQLKLVLAF